VNLLSDRLVSRKKLVLIAPAIALILSSGAEALCQFDLSPPEKLPACSFEVATIRPSRQDEQTRGGGGQGNGTIYRAQAFPLLWLIRAAFQVVDDEQVTGYPEWAGSAKYDVLGKISASQAAGRCLDLRGGRAAAIQELLADRFALRYHIVQRPVLVYKLEVAKGGPKFKPTESSPDYIAEHPQGWYSLFPPANIDAKNFSMKEFTTVLTTSILYKKVIDGTGLTGRYDFELKWDHWAPPGGWPPGYPIPQVSEDDPATGPPIFTALPQQMGLKLTATKVMGPVVVIDHIELPSPN